MFCGGDKREGFSTLGLGMMIGRCFDVLAGVIGKVSCGNRIWRC